MDANFYIQTTNLCALRVPCGNFLDTHKGKIKPASWRQGAKHRSFVGREGVEPSRCYQRQILSLLRLPIPPSPRQSVFYLILKCFPIGRRCLYSADIWFANL